MSQLSKRNPVLRDVILTPLNTSGDLSQIEREAESASVVALAGDPAKAEGANVRFSSLGILIPPQSLYVFSDAEDAGRNLTQVIRALGAMLAKPSLLKVGHGLKNLVKAFAGAGQPVEKNLFDTAIAAALLWEPTRLDPLASKYLDVAIPARQKEGAQDSSSPTLFGAEQPIERLGLKAVCSYRLYGILSRELERKGMERVAEVEMKVIPLLAEMEMTGLPVDRERLDASQRDLDAAMSELKDKLAELAGTDFNPNSPKQVAEIVYDRLGLPEVSGRSTRAWILKRLGSQHAFPKLLLDYRELAKLRDGYVAPLLRKVDPETGRIHPTFWQVVGTGRMSSDMHQIPRSGGIRECFIASPDCVLLSADYSQIELRVIAAFSQDEELLRSFRNEEDIHRRTASDVFSVLPEHVTKEQRQVAKVINFGLCYGMSARGLAATLSIPASQASEYMRRFFETYKGVRFYMTEVVKRARRRGYVKTLLGRRIPIRGIDHASASRRSGAEKAAINAPIQGTAGGDLIKLAMVRVRHALRRSGLGARLVLQMHDELLLEVKEGAAMEVARLVKKEMEAPVERLDVPLRVDVSAGPSWGDLCAILLA